MDLAIVIVTWNVRELALNAIQSALEDIAAHGPETEVWVVDNASGDGTANAIRASFPQVRLIASEKNLGFAAGNNLALREMGFGQGVPDDRLPRTVFLLNPDTLVHERAISRLFGALFADERVGLVGARLMYGDGSFQHSAFRFPGVWQTIIDLLPVPGRLYESRLNGRYPLRAYDAGQPFDVDHVLGATMMLRREVIQQVGMFDEQFFMYCEEIDWAMRIRKEGWRIQCVPAARVTHLEGRSTSQVRPESIVNLWRSRFQLYEKHYSSARVAAIRAVVRVGMARKMREAASDESLTPDLREALIAAYQTVARL
ncbi:MAG: glycosyltransferase family 2 protein [Anaerolineae bacterium]